MVDENVLMAALVVVAAFGGIVFVALADDTGGVGSATGAFDVTFDTITLADAFAQLHDATLYVSTHPDDVVAATHIATFMQPGTSIAYNASTPTTDAIVVGASHPLLAGFSLADGEAYLIAVDAPDEPLGLLVFGAGALEVATAARALTSDADWLQRYAAVQLIVDADGTYTVSSVE